MEIRVLEEKEGDEFTNIQFSLFFYFMKNYYQHSVMCWMKIVF